jgi:hypothetical protein
MASWSDRGGRRLQNIVDQPFDQRSNEGQNMAILGLLSPEFPSVSLSANLDAIAAAGAVSVQFDLASAVGQTFPSELSQDAVEAINTGFSARQLTLAALSGTYK